MLYYPGRSRAVDSNGDPVVNAKLAFYVTGTSDPAPVYIDAELENEHTQPVRSNSAGFYPPIYLDPVVTYKKIETTADDVTLPGGTVDPLLQAALSQSRFNEYLADSDSYKRTDAEEFNAVDPVDFTVDVTDYGNVRRYGAVATSGSTSSQTAFQDAISVAPDGGCIELPQTAANEFYYLTAQLSTGNKRLTIRGNGATIKFAVPSANQNLFSCGTGGITIENLNVIGTRTVGGDSELYGYVVGAAGSAYGTWGKSVTLNNVHIDGMSGMAQAKWVRQVRITGGSADNTLTDGNGVVGYYQACLSVIVDGFVQKDSGGTYYIHTNTDGAGNSSDLVVLRDCVAAVYPSIRYAKRVYFWGGKYWITNGDEFSGGILLTNVTETAELHGVDVRGAHGNTNLGGVLRITDGAGRIKISGGTYRAYSNIGNGIHLNGVALGTEVHILGAHVIDETGTNPNAGINIEPGVDGSFYPGEIRATVTGFAQNFKAYPAVTGQRVSICGRGATDRSILCAGLASTSVSLEIDGCDVDGTIEVANLKGAKVSGGAANKVILATGADGASCKGVTLRMKGTTDPTVSVEADNCQIVCNDVEADGTGSTGGSYGIAIASTADGTQVVSNRVRGFSQASGRGVRSAGTNTLISANQIDNCKGGIQTVAGGSYATGGDNMVTNSGSDGDTVFAGTDLSGTKLF
jgi:hypothetical protein